MRTLTALELSVIVKELEPLASARVSKIYQPTPRELAIKLYHAGSHVLRIKSGVGTYLTTAPVKAPKRLPGFCAALRKYVGSARLASASQHEMDRILILKFSGGFQLICELFSKGNFILTDKDLKILATANPHTFKDRTVRVGEKYVFPKPAGIDPRPLNEKKFAKLLKTTKREAIGAVLAADLGLGKTYAREVCWEASVDYSASPGDIDDKKAVDVFNKLLELFFRFPQAKEAYLALSEDGEPIDFSPFLLEWMEKYKLEKHPSFSSAIDKYYSYFKKEAQKSEQEKAYESELEKYKEICREQEKSIEEHSEALEKANKSAEAIYKNYQKIDALIKKIKSAINAGKSINAVKQIVAREAREGHSEAKLVKSINPKNKSVELAVGPGVIIDIAKSLEQNASLLYDRTKKLKKKIKGATKTIADAKEKLKTVAPPEIDLDQEIKTRPKKAARWYEKFHWFHTSAGNLAIGGRDATSNEIVVKKHAEKGDLVFHTEIAGSPFFILKSKGPAEQEIREVAIATASYSRAWKTGLGVADVYYINPDQVSKKAPSGEYVPRGGFMIYGRKNYVHNAPLELAIGHNAEGKIEGGAPSAVQKTCSKSIKIKPGYSKPSDVAKQIVKKLGLDNSYIDEVMKGLPAGKSDIKKSVTSVSDFRRSKTR